MTVNPTKAMVVCIIAAACSWQVAEASAQGDVTPLADEAPRFSRARARYAEGTFRVSFEVSERVRRTKGFILVQLDYLPSRGDRAKPYSATPIDQVSWASVGNGTLRATLSVSGPAPKDPESVLAKVSAAPTPHP